MFFVASGQFFQLFVCFLLFAFYVSFTKYSLSFQLSSQFFQPCLSSRFISFLCFFLHKLFFISSSQFFQLFVRCFLQFVLSVSFIKFSLYLPGLYLLNYLPFSPQNVLNIIQSVFPDLYCFLSFVFSDFFLKMFLISSSQLFQLFVYYLLQFAFSVSSTNCFLYLLVNSFSCLFIVFFLLSSLFPPQIVLYIFHSILPDVCSSSSFF